jgi:hypothetical protein
MLHPPRHVLPVSFLLLIASLASAAPLPSFDFRNADTVAQWKPAHDIGAVHPSPDGMVIAASGDDPFLVGPSVELPQGTPLALEMKVRSERGGEVEVFYFADHARAGQSVSARVAPGVWEELRLPLPPLGKRVTFRIDPPATKGGAATIASMALRQRMVVKAPEWPSPLAPATQARGTVRSGDLSVTHVGAPAGIEVRVGNSVMARGLSRSLIGYATGDVARWTPLPERAEVRPAGEALEEASDCVDADGAVWRVRRVYRPGRVAGSIDVETTVSVDRDRELLYFPAFVLLPGAGSFGATKAQAVFCGLEYLGRDDASRSEADVIGPAAMRLVPDTLKVTVPLMGVCAERNYVALAWEPQPNIAAVFDSPDRTFASGAHVMGVILPGSEGRGRIDGELLPELPLRLKANEPLTVKASVLGGTGDSVVPAIQQYVAMRGLPPVPDGKIDRDGYVRWAAGGWLESKIREGPLVRHAVWPGFGPHRAADAAVWMKWLAAGAPDATLAKRLDDVAAAVVSQVDPAQYDSAAVSHVRCPVASLVFGHSLENARAAEDQARAMLKRFEPDGSVKFRREANKEDFARTHPTPESNGLTATHVSRLLELAAVSGKRDLVDAAVGLLRGLDKYRDDVPRGAQSWEVPLHTPDILASAWLVRSYVTGFELTGDRSLLDRAVYWAWTGVPFVYLRNPASGPVGAYATIAVYGATNWVAPVWFGQPVQWCGLVYADALYRLADYDPRGPWKQLADGITASGIQQSWPASDSQRQGLLPDFYHLRAQISDGPAINPGTLQANAARLFGGPRVYAMRRLARIGVVVHAPGDIEVLEAADGAARVRVRGWPKQPYEVLLAGLDSAMKVRVNGVERADERDVEQGRVSVRVEGEAEIQVSPKESGEFPP